jgi:hypothetical protein
MLENRNENPIKMIYSYESSFLFRIQMGSISIAMAFGGYE